MSSVRLPAIIPARGGSKGIPKKNIMPFSGYPLLAWTIDAARRSSSISDVYVSTDDDEIAGVALEYGARVIKRPAALASDTASSEDALVHACERIAAEDGSPEGIVFLQATSPLRQPGEIDAAVKHFQSMNFDSMFSATEPEDFLLWLDDAEGLRSLNYDHLARKPRQISASTTRVLVETGSFYITGAAGMLKARNRLWGRIGYWLVPFWESFEIDSPEGAELCEALMRVHRLDRNPPQRKVDP